MEYVVIREFTDKDTQIHYTVGERYPRRGFASKERAEELSTDKNKRGKALIEPKGKKAEKTEESEETPKKAKSETVAKRKGSKK